jgi:hypothetical protein
MIDLTGDGITSKHIYYDYNWELISQTFGDWRLSKLYIKLQLQSIQPIPVIKASQIMVCKEMIGVYCEDLFVKVAAGL